MDLGSRLGWGGSSAGFRSSTVEAGNHSNSVVSLWRRLSGAQFSIDLGLSDLNTGKVET